jgi:ligand-binding sensor domain-containing protein
MSRYLFLTVVCALLSPLQPRAQHKELQFLHFAPGGRLSQTTVSWITQDDKGFLWLATEDGMFRYDGYAFEHYLANANRPGSLPHNLLLAVHKDRRGVLWTASFNGLCRYNLDSDTFTRFAPSPDDDFGARGNFIQRIAEDGSGTLWLATYNGLYAFEPRTGRFVHHPVDPPAPGRPGTLRVRSLLIDRQHRLWTGTEDGLHCLDLATRKMTRYAADPADTNALSDQVVRCIYQDRRGYLWVGTQGGLNKLDPATGRFTRYGGRRGNPAGLRSDTVLSLLEDARGRFWVGTWNGLHVMEPGQETFTAYRHDPADPASLSGNTVTALFTDRSGGVWIGTDRGVNKVETNQKKFRRYFSGSQQCKNDQTHVTALCEDGAGGYWLGTKNYLVRLDGDKHVRTYLDCRTGDGDVDVQSVARDQRGNLWVGAGEGFFALDPAGRRTVDFSRAVGHTVSDIYEDAGGTLWLGTLKGLYTYHPPTNTLRRFLARPGDPHSLGDNGAVTVREDRAGNLWIGTLKGGLDRLDRRTGRFTHYRHRPGDPASLSSDHVTVLHPGADGSLWVGTGNGLNRLDPRRGTFTRYPDPENRMGEVHGILEDDHRNLWINYREGIGKLNVRRNAWTYYQVSDGLQYEYNVGDNLRNAAGEMFFSGLGGLTVFHPDSIRPNPFVPPVVITQFSVFNKPVTPDGTLLKKSISETREIALSYRQAIFSFQFAALSFINPEENQYAYKLEGFEEDWNYAGTRRFASYSNVPGGKTYTFRVKASNDDGVWNAQGAAVRIYIAPPYWETVWFKLLAAATAVGLGFTGYKFRVRQYKRHRRQLEQEVRERTAEIWRQKDQLERQALEIARINELLVRDNRKLEENVKDLAEARVLQRGVTFAEFQQIYPTDEACLKFLADFKWAGGYACTKCGNAGYSPGPVPYARRCSRCSTIERATTGTIFSRSKFPITKGFYMLFLLSRDQDLTVDQLSEMVSHPRQTCWVFRKKVLEVIAAKATVKRKEDGWSHLILS